MLPPLRRAATVPPCPGWAAGSHSGDVAVAPAWGWHAGSLRAVGCIRGTPLPPIHPRVLRGGGYPYPPVLPTPELEDLQTPKQVRTTQNRALECVSHVKSHFPGVGLRPCRWRQAGKAAAGVAARHRDPQGPPCLVTPFVPPSAAAHRANAVAVFKRLLLLTRTFPSSLRNVIRSSQRVCY